MAYYIQQTVGKLVDARKDYTRARLAGDMAEALKIYRAATGDARPIYDPANPIPGALPPLTDTWWIYNAAQLIVSPNLSSAAWDLAAELHGDTEMMYTYLARTAATTYGGQFDVYWEY
jgi:hypothetical protein